MWTKNRRSPLFFALATARGAAVAAALPLIAAGCGVKKSALELDPPAGTEVLAVDVRNFRGTVEIREHPDEPIRVWGRVYTDSGPGQASQDELVDAVTIDAGVEEEGGRAVLRVLSTSAFPEQENHEVGLVIHMPRIDGVMIENAGGDVVVVDASGGVRIDNREGAIEFRTSKPMTAPVTLTNVDGNIYYQVPPGSTARFDLMTLKGEVAVKDRVGGSDQTYSTRLSHQSVLNGGNNAVVARTNQGDIRVWVMEDPVALTRTYKRTLPDFRDYLFLQGSRRYTRNLPEDHPEVQARRRAEPPEVD